MDKIIAALFLLLISFCLILVSALLGAILTMWAWNGSVAEVLHVSEVTFTQAFWLNMLGGMVFKSTSSSSK